MRRERKSAAAALVIAFISILLPFYFNEEEEAAGIVPKNPAPCFLRELRIRLRKDGKKWMTVLPMQDCRMLCMAQ